MRHQRGRGPHAGGRSRGLATSMAAADDDHIEARVVRIRGHGSVLPKATRRVKTRGSVSRETRGLFPDAEVPEDHVEHVLHVDPPGEPPEFTAGQSQLLGDDILAAAWALAECAIE